MAYDQEMVEKFRVAIAAIETKNVQERKMFGSIGFMINGRLTVCVGDEDVMYKFGADATNRLTEQGIAQPVVMGKRIMKEWATIDFAKLSDGTAFATYLRMAIAASAGH